jgi:homoserine dehydrogenase
MRVGLLGHGVVGAGVSKLLAEMPESFVVVGIAVRDPIGHGPAPLFTSDPDEVLERDLDVLVEVTGDSALARRLFAEAGRRGIAVVTANKAALAKDGGNRDYVVRASAAAGGSVPVLEAAGRGEVVAIEGILCGTANFVLEAVETGTPLSVGLDEARCLGLAEADATRDLDGRDAADKLALLASRVGVSLDPDAIPREPVTGDRDRGLRQVASLRRLGDGWEAEVRLLPVPPNSPIALARREENAVLISRADGSTEFLIGKGAGRWPTAEAVVADLLEFARTRTGEATRP